MTTDDGVDVRVRRFANGKLKLLVHFEKSSNVWCEGTWVPKKSEVELISEALEAVDKHNINKYKKKKSEWKDERTHTKGF